MTNRYLVYEDEELTLHKYTLDGVLVIELHRKVTRDFVVVPRDAFVKMINAFDGMVDILL